MGWIIDRDGLRDHEGHAAYVTADGRTTGTSTGTGVLLSRPDADERVAAAWAAGHPPDNEDMYELVLWDDVVGWQTQCACGWTGKRWERSATLPGQYSGHDPDDAVLADGETVEARAMQDWDAHIGPLGQLGAVSAAAAEAEQARQRLDQAVAAARAGGASWADVGRAAGMARQSAHERWGRGTSAAS
jgi:hypothetical protein